MAYAGFNNQLFGGLGELHALKRLATHGVAKRLLGGMEACFPENFFKWCNLVRFGAYFHKFFTLKKSKSIHFLYKNNDKL